MSVKQIQRKIVPIVEKLGISLYNDILLSIT